MTHDKLKARLRSPGIGAMWGPSPFEEAANHIERLEADNARLRDAVADIPQPYEYLSAADLKLVRPFIDALRTWRHKHTAALKG